MSHGVRRAALASSAIASRERRRGLRWLALAMAALGSGCSQSPNAHTVNIILISIDTLNRSSLAAFDPAGSRLPHLDRFARDSSLFNSAYSTASWTLPSQASLLTGLYPDRHGATDQKLRISRHVHTFADSLAAGGFETVAFTDGGYVDANFGFGKGFEYYDGRSSEGSRLSDLKLPRDGKPHEQPGRALFDRVISFVGQHRQSDPPFFVFLQTYAVHDYYQRHPWAIQATRETLDESKLREASEYLECLWGRTPCPDDWPVLSELYRGELVHLDAAFGRLMAALEESQLAASTLVVFLSDHGEGFDFARKRLHHGGRLHEDGIRIPLMMRGPTVVSQRLSDAISLVDVMPTVLDLVGVPIPPGLDGVSMAEAVRGGEVDEAPRRYAMEFSNWWDEGGLQKEPGLRTSPLQLAVMTSDLWYIRDASSREEIYDMRDDPAQLKNLSGDSESFDQLRSWVDARWDHQPPQEALAPNSQIRERLRALGYVD